MFRFVSPGTWEQLSPCVCAASCSYRISGASDVLISGMPSPIQSCLLPVRADWPWTFRGSTNAAGCGLRALRQQHQNVRAVVAAGQRSLNGIDLPANTFDTGNALLLFFIDVRHDLLAYPMGI